MEEKGDTVHDSSITLIPTSDEDNKGKKNYKSTSLRNLDAEIPNEY